MYQWILFLWFVWLVCLVCLVDLVCLAPFKLLRHALHGCAYLSFFVGSGLTGCALAVHYLRLTQLLSLWPTSDSPGTNRLVLLRRP